MVWDMTSLVYSAHMIGFYWSFVRKKLEDIKFYVTELLKLHQKMVNYPPIIDGSIWSDWVSSWEKYWKLSQNM